MNVSKLFKDDDAVSPVIGVILMVAITVILAAVIGAFVLNIGGSQDTAPQVSFDFKQDTPNSGEVTAVVQSASKTIPQEEITVQTSNGANANNPSSDLSSGTSWVVAGDSTSLSDGEEIMISWNSPSSDQSSIIGEYTYES